MCRKIDCYIQAFSSLTPATSRQKALLLLAVLDLIAAKKINREFDITIIMTTHSMEEAQYLCDTIAIMDGGRIIAQGSPSELITAHCSTNTITLPRVPVEAALADLDLDSQGAGLFREFRLDESHRQRPRHPEDSH